MFVYNQVGSKIPVPLKPKIQRRLYEHIVFLSCLNPLLSIRGTDTEPPSAPAGRGNPEDVFRRFVNSVALLCDTEKGGNTVTAVTVLADPPTYLFSSNKRSDSEMDKLKTFLETVLRGVDSSGPSPDSSVVLRKAVVHCKPRVQFYIQRLQANIISCLEESDRSVRQCKICLLS